MSDEADSKPETKKKKFPKKFLLLNRVFFSTSVFCSEWRDLRLVWTLLLQLMVTNATKLNPNEPFNLFL